MTSFAQVYNSFLSRITDDMYLMLTPRDTIKDLQGLLLYALPGFEFPRKDLFQYQIECEHILKEEYCERNDFIIEETDDGYIVDRSYFYEDLTPEEVNIIAILMMDGWLQRQVTSIENTRMKYSGVDFKLSSQANHLSKLQALLSEVHRQSLHMQRLYKRRKIEMNGRYASNWSCLRDKTVIED